MQWCTSRIFANSNLNCLSHVTHCHHRISSSFIDIHRILCIIWKIDPVCSIWICFSGVFTGVCLTMDLPVDPFLCYSNLLTLAMPDATGFNPGGLTFSADCRVAVITIPGVRICKSRRLETRRVLSQVLFFSLY